MENETPTKSQKLDTLVAHGEAAFCNQQLETANQYFCAALKLEPTHGPALLNLAAMYQQVGDSQTAESLLLKASVLSKLPVEAFISLANLSRVDGDLTKATNYLQQAIDIEGESPRILEQMSFICDQLGDPDAATQLYRRAIQLSQTRGCQWHASFCEIDITPEISQPTSLQGYFSRRRVAERIISPLKMQMLLCEDQFQKRVLFVTADIFGFGDEMVEVIRNHARIWGIPPAAVVLNASHTHCGPGTVDRIMPGLGSLNLSFVNDICQKVGQALPMLYQRLRPAQLSVGQVHGQVGFCRRTQTDNGVEMSPNLEGWYETATPLLQVETDDGKRLLMINHGCHPTGLGAMPAISAGYPGAVRDALLTSQDFDVVMFCQGAAGDAKPGLMTDSGPKWSHTIGEVVQLGEQLAAVIADGLSALKTIEGPLGISEQSVVAPLANPGSMQQVFDEAIRVGVLPKFMEAWASCVGAHHAETLDEVAYSISCVSLGQALFINMPIEPMGKTAARLRQLNQRHDVVFTLGYTNGLMGYVPTEEYIEEGGYEAYDSAFVYALPSPFAAGVEHNLLEASYVAALNVQPPVEVAQSTLSTNKSRQQAFFCMSTGRSGTQTLYAMLRMAKNAHVWHHPEPFMTQETLHAYRGDVAPSPTFWIGRGRIIREAWDAGLIHGETDHNMTPFCDAIAEDIPNSRFLVLVRDPREFVRSGMRRNYYRGSGEWEEGRLRPKSDDDFALAFAAMSQFEQVCWLWAETHRHIERIRAKIGNQRVMVVRFEDLVSDVGVTKAIFEFLNLDGFNVETAADVLGQKLNAQRGGNFPHPCDWSDEMHQRCWQIVGEAAMVYGYHETYHRRKEAGAA